MRWVVGVVLLCTGCGLSHAVDVDVSESPDASAEIGMEDAGVDSGEPDAGVGDTGTDAREPDARMEEHDAGVNEGQLTIDPPSAVFDEQWIGFERQDQTFTIVNTGDTALRDLAVSISGDSTSFRAEPSQCDELAPLDSCSVDVSFAPVVGGPLVASLHVGNASVGVQAELSGVGKDPADYNRVFVSSQSFAMNLGSVEAYDTRCNELASAAGLNNVSDDGFIAWVSSSTSAAASRLAGARGFVRMDGRAFADELLQSEVFRGVEHDEFGRRLAPGTTVVTGTLFDGTLAPSNCSDWSSTSNGVSSGRADAGPRDWTTTIVASCELEWPIYCVEKTTQRELIAPRFEGRLIYLTNEDFGGLEPVSAEASCEASKPSGAGEVVPFVAMNGTVAADLLDANATYVRPDGVVVGTGAQLAMGVWLSGAWQQGDGTYPTEIRRVWTGSTAIDELGDETCSDWSTNNGDARGRYGLSQRPTDGSFWRRGNLPRRCSSSTMRFYCVETGASLP